MVTICEEFGEEYSVGYNAKKTVCIKFSRVNDRNHHRPTIRLNGMVLEWSDCVKDLGNYIKSDLTESEEIRHKQGDFIGRVNGLLMRYKDAKPEVLMQLLSSYCTHLYGSQAWQLSDKSILRMVTTWNRAVRKIWNLPPDSHTIYLCGLNNGQHVWDTIIRRFCKMYECMKNSKNDKLVYLVRMAQMDRRCILEKNVSFICKKRHISRNDLWNDWKKSESVYGLKELKNNEETVSMIKELNEGIVGFNSEEIYDILTCITTYLFI